MVLNQLGNNVNANIVSASLLNDSAADAEVPASEVSDTPKASLTNKPRNPTAILVGYYAA